jgi:hypothetical protein
LSESITGSGTRLTHEQALNLLSAADIRTHSSGNCSDKNNKRCTSLDGIRQSTIDGIIAFKKASNCDIVITAGTEVGHAPGPYSHSNGYKLDIRMTQNVTHFIQTHFTFIGLRSLDQASQYDDSKGNRYAQELHPGGRNDHWDITYLASE